MFISFEGTEGVGKTTLIRKIYEYLVQQGQEVVLTREPGGTPMAEQIRSLLLSVNHDENMSNDTELLLMYAARAQHLQQVIVPALLAGKTVLCDRFTDASFAYQCAGRGLSREKLHAPIELGMSRARERGALDRFEQEKVTFFEKVRAGYQELFELSPERMKRVDATQSPEQVFAQAVAYLK